MAVQHLQPGTMLRQYKVLKVLGAGGFGITYLVKDEPLDKLFAVKEYYPEAFAQRTGETIKANRANVDDFVWGKERFMTEAKTLARFRHQNIVGVTQIFEENRTAYIVLEYQSGHSFNEWLTELGRSPSQVELDSIVEPILGALETIHRNELLHRDIAPDNIYIRDDGSPVLIDFGSAREAIAQRTKTLSAIVKTGYSPAEQYSTRGSGQGPWSDIYAFAATLYRAVTGEHPEEATDRMLTDNYVSARQAAKGDYRTGFLDAIDWGLNLLPKARPQSVTEWRAALLTQAAGAVITKVGAVINADRLKAHLSQVETPAAAPAAEKSKSSLALYFTALILIFCAGLIWLNTQMKDTSNSSVAKSDNTNQTVDQSARDRALFSNAHGNPAMLKNYLGSCNICANAVEARAEIANIEERQRLARLQASFFNFEICNRTNYAAAAALIGRKDINTANWTIEGWKNIGANSCVPSGQYVKGKIYAMAQVKAELRGWFGNDVKQCVEFPGPFNRTISQTYTCPTNGRIRGFISANVSEDHYVWNIVGEPTASEDDLFTFEVCNKSGNRASVAVAGKPNLGSGFIVAGWFNVSPGLCTDVGKYEIGIIYAMANVYGRKDLGWRGKDMKLCVEYPGPFHYLNNYKHVCNRSRLESFRSIAVMRGPKFTWTLNP